MDQHVYMFDDFFLEVEQRASGRQREFERLRGGRSDCDANCGILSVGWWVGGNQGSLLAADALCVRSLALRWYLGLYHG